MKKILCPTDFSTSALNAVSYAAKLARKTGAVLTLFNVQSPMELTPEEAMMGRQYNLQQAQKALDEASHEVNRVFKVSCEGMVAPAMSVSDAIGQYGENFDLLVMGTNGPDDLFQFVSGSTAYQITRRVSIPVLLVPEHVGYQDISRMVYAFDFIGETPLQITPVVNFARTVGCELSLIQVMESYDREKELEFRDITESFRKLYSDDVRLSWKIIYGEDVAERLLLQVGTTETDLLAVSSVHRNFFDRVFHQSVIRKLSKEKALPVLVFHE